MWTLYTFTISHFAEKARWALDYKRVPYEERRLMPGPHMFVTTRVGKRSSVPLLVDGERVVQGSGAIIDHVEACVLAQPLTPNDPAERAATLDLERSLDADFGEMLRRAFYADALDHPELVVPLFTQGGPWWGKPFYGFGGFRFVASRIREMYSIERDAVARYHDAVAAELAQIDERLRGRRYLFGERFSRADLTLAALAAPMWDPPEHSTRWPPPELYPPRVAELRRRFLGTRTYEHVMRMYREHRRVSPAA